MSTNEAYDLTVVVETERFTQTLYMQPSEWARLHSWFHTGYSNSVITVRAMPDSDPPSSISYTKSFVKALVGPIEERND